MISATELAAMRTVLNASLPDTATIQRATTVSDSGGGYTQTWATIATVSCRVAPLTGQEAMEGGQVSEEGTYVITVPALTDVREQDRLTVGGVSYEVHAVRNRSNELARRLDCSKTS